MSAPDEAVVGSVDGDDPVAALMAAMGDELLERLNADFEDSMVLVGRVLGQRPGAVAAEITTVDRRGVGLVVTDADGEHAERVDFAAAVTGADQLRASLFGLVTQARARSGERGVTSAEREMAELATARTFLTSVGAVQDITPHLRQITCRGGDLAAFAPAGPDAFCFVLLPPPGRATLGIDQSFTWEQHARLAPEVQPVGAYYTVRRWRPVSAGEPGAEVDMLFVLHGDAGHASAWAARARPGDPVALWGPRTSYHPPAGTDRLVLVADETGLAAVAAILEQRPAWMPAAVIVEVADESERYLLPAGPGIDVTWCYRDGAPPGTTTLLADAVDRLDWPGGRPYVWGAGESRTMTAIRKHVRHELGLDRSAVSLVAYWRRAS